MKVLAGRLKQGNEKGRVWAGSMGILDSLLQPAKVAGDDNKLSDSESDGKSQVDHSRGMLNLRGRGDGERLVVPKGVAPPWRARGFTGQARSIPSLFCFTSPSNLHSTFAESSNPVQLDTRPQKNMVR